MPSWVCCFFLPHFLFLSSTEMSCVWVPLSQATISKVAPSVTALLAADQPSLNQSGWRTLERRSCSMETWRSTTSRWWVVLRSCSKNLPKPDVWVSSGPFLNQSTFALRTSAPQPSRFSLGYRRPPARYHSSAKSKTIPPAFSHRTDSLSSCWLLMFSS